jgi:hypothetical protein
LPRNDPPPSCRKRDPRTLRRYDDNRLAVNRRPCLRRVGALRRNPELLAAIMENPGAALDTRLILALKAIR